MEFLAGAIATVCACTVTHPVETCKSRLQLQGELASGARVFRSLPHAFWTILRQEGVGALYRGLAAGYAYQIVMNSLRLGSYPHLKTAFGVRPVESGTQTRVDFAKSLAAGALAGALGATAASPAYMIKTRLQTQVSASSKLAAVGHQHNYTGLLDAARKIVAADGVAGLWRGWEGSALRVSVGGSIQLSTYDRWKQLSMRVLQRDSSATPVHFLSAMLSGLCVVAAMQPFDLVSTRLYNQKVVDGRGALYTGPLDCFVKTVSTEGVSGLYKGTVAHYLRVGPHSLITLMMLERVRQSFGLTPRRTSSRPQSKEE